MLVRWWRETREVLWLASIVGALSVLGVALAAAVVMTGAV
jgi:hypothetical protein